MLKAFIGAATSWLNKKRKYKMIHNKLNITNTIKDHAHTHKIMSILQNAQSQQRVIQLLYFTSKLSSYFISQNVWFPVSRMLSYLAALFLCLLLQFIGSQKKQSSATANAIHNTQINRSNIFLRVVWALILRLPLLCRGRAINI